MKITGLITSMKWPKWNCYGWTNESMGIRQPRFWCGWRRISRRQWQQRPMTRDDIDPSSYLPANGLPDQNILVPASHELLQNQSILEFKPTSETKTIITTPAYHDERKSHRQGLRTYHCWDRWIRDCWRQRLCKITQLSVDQAIADAFQVSAFVCSNVRLLDLWLTSIPSSVNMSMLSKTDHTTVCPWKGDAAYYSINLDSEYC